MIIGLDTPSVYLSFVFFRCAKAPLKASKVSISYRRKFSLDTVISGLQDAHILETDSLILLFPSYCSIVVSIVLSRKSGLSFFQSSSTQFNPLLSVEQKYLGSVNVK